MSVGSRSRPRLLSTEKTRNADCWLGVDTATKKQRCTRKAPNCAQAFQVVAEAGLQPLQHHLGIAPDVALRLVFQLRRVQRQQLRQLQALHMIGEELPVALAQ